MKIIESESRTLKLKVQYKWHSALKSFVGTPLFGRHLDFLTIIHFQNLRNVSRTQCLCGFHVDGCG